MTKEIYSPQAALALSERVGMPQNRLKVIHIAGTNGKGSVGTYLANILAQAGYTVGRYLSPPLFDHRESVQRITCADGKLKTEWMTQKQADETLARLNAEEEALKCRGIFPSPFEKETVLAFLLFVQWGVDFVIAEAGLGGKTDATNILHAPLLCVFTPISLDHTEILGDSITDIAKQKYGIVKPGTSVVSHRQKECALLLCDVCKKNEAELFFTEKNAFFVTKETATRTEFTYKETAYVLSQGGNFLARNALLALEAVFCLERMGKASVSLSCVKRALFSSYWRGRFDLVSDRPFVLFDGAHNTGGAQALAASLSRCFPDERFAFVFGVFQDKNYREMLALLLPLAVSVTVVKAPDKRGVKSEVLKKECAYLLAKQNRRIPVNAAETVEEALKRLCPKNGLKSEQKTVVCGSLSLAKGVYDFFEKPYR